MASPAAAWVLACASLAVVASGSVRVFSGHAQHWAGTRPRDTSPLLTAPGKSDAVVSYSRLQYNLITDVRHSMQLGHVCEFLQARHVNDGNLFGRAHMSDCGQEAGQGHGNRHGWPLVAQCAKATSPFLDVPPIRRLFVHLGKFSRNVGCLASEMCCGPNVDASCISSRPILGDLWCYVAQGMASTVSTRPHLADLWYT